MAKVDSHRFAQPFERKFAGRINRPLRPRDMTHLRRDMDDRARKASSNQPRDHRLRHEQRRGHVEIHHRLVIFGRDLRKA